jgi:peptidoglycan/LPS O-acetylase OafA/YrhL
MWTIQYEFRCYLLIGLLGVLGLLKRRWLMLGLTVLFMTAHILATFPWVTVCLDALHDRAAALFGDRALTLIGADSPQLTIRFTAVFLVGSCFYLFRNEVETKLTSTTAVSCGFLAAVFMYRDPHFAEASLTTLGAFTLFWVAFKASIGPLQKINHSWDISYGVYLYGWPIATYFRWAHPSISPWTLATLTFLVALVFGSISWFALEKWTKDLVLCPSARALKID